MADEAAVAAILAELPDEADLFGVDASSVGILLDSGLSQNKATLATWRTVAAKSSTMANVSESGSSRDLGRIFDNAIRMIEHYQARVDAEDKLATVDPATGKARGRTHTAVRV